MRYGFRSYIPPRDTDPLASLPRCDAMTCNARAHASPWPSTVRPSPVLCPEHRQRWTGSPDR